VCSWETEMMTGDIRVWRREEKHIFTLVGERRK
jgi:hypothetical protein